MNNKKKMILEKTLSFKTQRTSRKTFLLMALISATLSQDFFSSKTSSILWNVGNGIGRFTRFSLNSTIQFKDSSAEIKVDYAKKNLFTKDSWIFSIFSDHSLTSNITDKYDLTFHKNEGFAGRSGNLFLEFKSKESHENFDGCFVIEATPFLASETWAATGGVVQAATQGFDKSQASIYCNKMNFESQYVPNFNWKKFSYYLFGFVRIYFQIFALIVVFGRLFVPEYAKLRVIWIGQTIILWQFLLYSGLQSGNFGGVIDSIQEGKLQASKEILFMNLNPQFSTKFIDSMRGFVVYKFYVNEIKPALTHEAFYEILALVIVVILQRIAEFTYNVKIMKVAREINSGLGLVVMVKLIFISLNGLYSFSIIGEYNTFWHWLNIILFAFVGVYYTLRFVRMAVTVNSINYLHSRGVYQEGKVEYEQGSDWAFDTYISMETNVKIRVVEFIFLILIPNLYNSGYEAYQVGSVVLVIIWLCILGFNIHKLAKFEGGTNERDDSKIVIIVNLVIMGLMTIMSIIMMIFCLSKKMGLKGVKFLTTVYVICLFLATLALLIQAPMRLLFSRRLPDYIRDMRNEEKRKRQVARYEQEKRDEEKKTLNDKSDNVGGESGN